MAGAKPKPYKSHHARQGLSEDLVAALETAKKLPTTNGNY